MHRRARVCAFLAVLAVLAAGCEGGDTAGVPTVPTAPTASSRPAEEAPPEVEQWQETAAKYAPMVWLAKDDPNGPMDALTFIANSELWFDHGPACVETEPVATGLDAGKLADDDGYRHRASVVTSPPRGKQPMCTHDSGTEFRSNQPYDLGPSGGKGFHLDLDDDMRDAGGPDAPVYWQVVAAGAHSSVIVYWLFYPYNDFTNNHEGDWERVAVVVTDGEPAAVVFWRHELPTCLVPWGEFEKVEGTHPVTFSARGSHGSYYGEGAFPHAGGTDRTSKGREWRTWSEVRAAQTEPWFGYRGLWGVTGPRYFSGIPGPYPDRNLDDAKTVDACHTVPEHFFGSWKGPVNQPSSDTEYSVRLTIRDGEVGDTVGSTFYPGLGCSGTLTLVEKTADKLVVREVIASDPQLTCVPEVMITLTPTDTGLYYETDVSTAELTRE